MKEDSMILFVKKKKKGFYDFVKLLVHFALFRNFQLVFFYASKGKQRTKS